MDLVTHAVLVLSAVAITLGLLYLRFWFSERSRKDFLFFALACFSTAVYSWFEIAIMNSDSLEHTARLLWWAQFPATFAVISVPLFLYLYLNNRRRWLFWSIVSLRVCIAPLALSADSQCRTRTAAVPAEQRKRWRPSTRLTGNGSRISLTSNTSG